LKEIVVDSLLISPVDWKNTIPSASDRNRIFATSSHCDTWWQSVQLWNS